MGIASAAPGDQPPLDPKLERLISAAFLDELYARSYEYYVGLDSFKNESGERFQKDAVRSELWNALTRLRQARFLKEHHKNKPELAPDPEFTREAETFLSKYYVRAHYEGDLISLRNAEKLSEILLRDRPVGKILWHHYVGLAAWELLFVFRFNRGGRFPTKMAVKKRAIAKRKKSGGGKYPSPPERWDRIFKALDLGDLPSAQGEGR